MKRSDRRQFDKNFRKLLRTSGDNCSLCGAALSHNCKTFGGITVNGLVALTSECCSNSIDIFVQGVFVTKNYDTLSKLAGGNMHSKVKSNASSPSMKQEALHNYFNTIDTEVNKIAVRAGLDKKQPQNVFLEDSTWKRDDAQWFRSHPDRSHRIRSMYDGELNTLLNHEKFPAPPDGHRIEILVRQVEVGKRIRIPFVRNIRQEIPDAEEVIHAIFDIVSRSNPLKSVISSQEVNAIAEKYTKSKRDIN